uniref:Peptidase A1 domain-containing protein n=2 Tax=Wuchereria bancrofti TaxID=6293 RepID=A0A1I8ERB1_WUCBA
MKLTVIFCTLLVTQLFAEYQIDLYPVHDKLKHRTGYALNVIIGKPGKEFRVLLDTLTSLLWVPGTNRIHPFCYNKQFYSKFDSTSCSTVFADSLAQCYGIRAVNLWSWNDDILIHASDGKSINLLNSPFGTLCFLNWPEWENYQEIDGIFGLSALHTDRLSEGVFGFFPILNKDDSDKTATLTLGGRNNKSCDLSNEKHEPLYFLGNRYNFQFLAAKMGNREFFKLGVTLMYPNIMDPYITVPIEFMKQITYDLGAQIDVRTAKYLVDCKQSFKPFEIFTVENKYIVEPKHFIIKHNPDDTKCELAFKSFDGFEQEIMLGLPFLHQYCMTLEPREIRVNFSPVI